MLYRAVGIVAVALGIGMFIVGSYILGLMLLGGGAIILRNLDYTSRKKFYGRRQKEKDSERSEEKEWPEEEEDREDKERE